MVLAYTVLGAMLAPVIAWDRVTALLVIYFLALGIGAHAFDAIGSRGNKPWGDLLSIRQLWFAGLASLASAYVIGVYYMISFVPLLWPIAIAEGFLLLAYNLEWFGGRFHTDGWFAFSWGLLPALAGYVMQTNAVSAAAIVLAVATALFSLVEIKASRPYKRIKRDGRTDAAPLLASLETILKCVSGGVILLAVCLAIVRWNG
jgi:hypothetical protein